MSTRVGGRLGAVHGGSRRWVNCVLALALALPAVCALAAATSASGRESPPDAVPPPRAAGATADGGGVVHAASCSQGDVQAAIDAASDGDIVVVPAGTCTWTTSGDSEPAVQIAGKGIMLQGAGVGQTIITDGTGTGWNNSLIQVEAEVGKFFRITGFTFTGVNSPSGIGIEGTSTGFRIDHNRFENHSDFSTAVLPSGRIYGLVDHNSLLNSRVLVRDDEDAAWMRPLALGTDVAVYLEDNDFDCTLHCNAVDGSSGGRYVFRYNTMTNTHVEAHSGCPSGLRATFSYEIYSNTMIASDPTYRPFLLRGGTGVVFNNVVTGSYTTPHIHIDDQRTCNGVSGYTCHSPWDRCDGTSPYDGNQPGTSGYPCRDQIGRSTDSGRYSPQSLEPLYEWGNTFAGSDVDIFINPVMCELTWEHIKEGRDYFNDTVRPGYTPYEYPHPLTNDLVLSGSPGDRAARLTWAVRAILPAMSTWRIDYYTAAMTVPHTATDALSSTRSLTLHGLDNYVWYTITLYALDEGAPLLTDTVRVMPTHIAVHLPLTTRGE
jgi:hypothetical protein